MIIGILSDIHEDLIRLKEVLTIFEKKNVNDIVCLGDLVGFSVPYYPYLDSRDANEVVRIIKENCTFCVIGNHDLYAVHKIPHQRSFFNYPANWYGMDFHIRKQLASGKVYLYEDNELSSLLTSQNKDYLMSLPEYVVMDCGAYNIMLTHYAFPDITGSSTHEVLFPSDLQEHWEFMITHQCLYSFSGNDHFEGMRLFTENQCKDYGFEEVQLPDRLLWLHGPTVSKGTFKNGCMIYDTERRVIEAIPLYSETHTIAGNREVQR
ncbi:metallophosphoesterase family protein [Paenibacillus enshidis]|uniref:Metallophosphoesterase family protein n=1 Tax=Paenibacillus enshidis TaxID=1458439 RepID=A0ABV5AS67_9BACL